MARTMGRGSVSDGGRGVGRGAGRGVGLRSDRGGGQTGDRGRSNQSGGQDGDLDIMARTMGRGSVSDGGRGVGRGASRGVGLRSNQSGGQDGDLDIMTRSMGRGVGRGGSQASGRGVRQGSGIGSNDTMIPSPIENSDSDDESTFHDAPTRRGPASQVQVPELMNREWIWIEDGEFSNQGTSTRIIGGILKAMWNGPWDSWRDVPKEDRERLFERFQGYFQWEERWNTPIYRHWEDCLAGKFPYLLRRVRNVAKETSVKQGLEVEGDMSVLIDFKPPWIKNEIWKKMIDTWNTSAWKEKSKRNSHIRRNSKGGKHTLGSQTYNTAKRKAAHTLGRELEPHEMWKQSHCRKGSRPLDKDISCSSSLVSDVDLEENVQEENLVWVDDRAKETWVKYNGYLVETYGEERSSHPKFDEDLWSRAWGKNKGKVFGFRSASNLNVHGKQDHEIKKLNGVIKELVKEKEEEKERLNEIIAELKAEKEKDKVEKDAMSNRMSSIEAMIKNMARR